MPLATLYCSSVCKKLLAICCLVVSLQLSAQQKESLKNKVLLSVKTTSPIHIDGSLSDSAWRSAALATNLVEWRPTFGLIEDSATRTEVYFLYDDSAIYVGGFCHEQRDSISKELVGRDVVGVNDFVGVMFDTYNDKINGFGYYVTPLGEQFDAKYSSTGEDGSWNSVYESVAKIVPGGWVFEMRIPYSAIRFSNNKNQNWGMNITRKRNKAGKQFMWNPINPTIGGTLFSQFGLFTGLHDIKPPLRLSFSPYFSLYTQHFPSNDPAVKSWSSSVNGGMDVKYGISQSFTLDLTLIPDFGQVQSDNHVLNLSPFEVKYNENRTFFTEGTELFSKGNLFYSRRIGGQPMLYYDAYYDAQNTGSTLVKNPSETKLINAIKLSGRTSSGLGIGVLNAVTNEQYATLEDTTTHQQRRVLTNPLTNYNIFVLDQALKHNSSISLVNTSTVREGNFYDANVTAALWDFYDKKNMWNFYGQINASQLFVAGKDIFGYSHSISFSKASGNFNFNVYQELADDKYSQNDLGYATNNNYLNHGFWLGYKFLKPNKTYNNLYINYNFSYSRRYKPGDYQQINMNVNANSQLKNLWTVGTYLAASPAYNDFYEPRYSGYVYKAPALYTAEIWANTNSAKKYSASLDVTYQYRQHFKTNSYYIYITNQYRFNKKLTISLNNNIEINNNARGFATIASDPAGISQDSIIFGNRNRHTVENIYTIKYNFNNKMGITLRVRHYWSKVDYKSFFLLQTDGKLEPITARHDEANDNTNFFNVDMVYTWQFSLGSFLNISWKNSIETEDSKIHYSYFKNFSNTWNAPQLNNLSVKLIYFLDYLKLKKKKK